MTNQNNNKRGPRLVEALALTALPTTDPFLWPDSQKRVMLVVIAGAAMLPGFCSTIYLPGTPQVREDLHTQDIMVTMTLSLFILMNGIGPVIWSVFSDTIGRRRVVYLASLIVFIGASIACYFAKNIIFLIVFRCIQSFGASSATSLNSGTISDLYRIRDRGSAIGGVSAGSSIGPLLGPIIGGAVTSAAGWRTTFLLAVALAAAVFLGMLFFVPETCRDPHVWGDMEDIVKRLEREGEAATPDDEAAPDAGAAQDARPGSDAAEADGWVSATGADSKSSTEVGDATFAEKGSLPAIEDDLGAPKPTASGAADGACTGDNVVAKAPATSGGAGGSALSKAIKVLGIDYVVLCAIFGAFPFAIMFTCETLIPILYEEVYGLNSTLVGFCYLAGGVSNVIASIASGRSSDYYLRRDRERRQAILTAAGATAAPATPIGGDPEKPAAAAGNAATAPPLPTLGPGGTLNLPEDRITPFSTVSGMLLLPLGALLFGFAVHFALPLALPLLGFALVCFAFMDSMVTASAYIVDAVAPAGLASSGTAVAMLFRNTMACCLSVGAVPWMRAVGVEWVAVCMAGIAVVTSCGLLYLKRRGGFLRARSAGRLGARFF